MSSPHISNPSYRPPGKQSQSGDGNIGANNHSKTTESIPTPINPGGKGIVIYGADKREGPAYTSLTPVEKDKLYVTRKLTDQEMDLYLKEVSVERQRAEQYDVDNNPGSLIHEGEIESAVWSEEPDTYSYETLSPLDKKRFFITRRFTKDQAIRYANSVASNYYHYHPEDPGAAQYYFSHPTDPNAGVYNDYIVNKQKKKDSGVIIDFMNGFYVGFASVFEGAYNIGKNATTYVWEGVGVPAAKWINSAYDALNEWLGYILPYLEAGSIILLLLVTAIGIGLFYFWWTYVPNPITGARAVYQYENQKADALSKSKGISKSAALSQVVAGQVALGTASPVALVGQIAADTIGS